MTRYRQRIGGAGCEYLLKETVNAGLRAWAAVKRSDFRRITVDRTVQDKAVGFPTDGKLLNRSREPLIRLSRKRPFERSVIGEAFDGPADEGQEQVVYRHASEVECISKGKAHKRYEFDVKASVAVTNRRNFVVGGQSLPDNPHDGHILAGALEQVEKLTAVRVREVFVDRGCRGHGVADPAVYISGQRRGMMRRQAIELVIGHLKQDIWLGRNWLKGVAGDQMNVMLSCAGHNLRLILRLVRFFRLRIWAPLGVGNVGYPAFRA